MLPRNQQPFFAASPRLQRGVAGQARSIERLTALLQAANRDLAQVREKFAAETAARHAAEEELAASEQRYRFLANSLPQIIWTSKPDGNLESFNQRWFDYTGMTLEQTKDWGWQLVIHPDDLPQCVERWTRSFTTEVPYEVECRFRRGSDGSYRWHLGRAFPMRNEHGEIVQWVGTCTDIDDQKLARELLERRVAERTAELRKVNAALGEEITDREIAEQANAEILANSLDVICTIDEQGCFIKVSAACERVWGYTPQELIGRLYMDFVHPEDHELTQAAAAKIMGGEAARGFENRYIRKDGTTVAIMWTANWSAICQTMFCVARDVSEEKRSHEELMQAKEAAEAASRAKSDFLANMSHEIRTPMNGILGMVDLALSSGPKPHQERYLRTIQNSAESLLTVINDILDFSKIEAGKLEMEAIHFDLHDVVGDTISTLSGRAIYKGLKLTWKVDADVPTVCIGDPTRLRQILTNLIGNSLKFTETGFVAVKVSLQSSDAESVLLHFYVTDSGVGIRDDLQAGIFEAFQQADTSTSRKFGGSGLGLSICRSLVAQMGGRIAVESTAGEGSTFHFTARFGVADAGVTELQPENISKPSSSDQPRALRILLAEDNRVNQEVAVSTLRNVGHSVMVAQNGREAVEMAVQDEFDIILMDIQMPVMDGFEATGAIRALEHERGTRTPIIAMTAHAMQGDRERCMAGGMDDYISKPFRRPKLVAILERWSTPVISPENISTETTLEFSTMEQSYAPRCDQELLQELQRDPELLRKLQDSWNQEGPVTLMQLEHAVDGNDFTQAARAAHTLKGMFGSVGDNHGYGLANAVEEVCHRGDIMSVRQALPELSGELETVAREIARCAESEKTMTLSA